jgi:hypothetical protein
MKRVSVVIPTYNDATSLRICLDALQRQTMSPADFEVIVVDNGSRDETGGAKVSVTLNGPGNTPGKTILTGTLSADTFTGKFSVSVEISGYECELYSATKTFGAAVSQPIGPFTAWQF